MYNNNQKEVKKEINEEKKTVPNVKGMGLKDAVYLLENMNLRVAVKGRGKVYAQSLAAGVSINKGQTITLELN